ncbi:MAG: LLM class flavin-dependent oxidoreductase [Candidatus Rokubacteria bacterium]|nr:LLM class flavin-dependent oxidoreductase [Candidatus Rokubacteria bacterium]
MRFGLFTEFECPARTSEATAFDEAMAQMVAAEALGFDAVWLGELHFQKDRSVLSSPLVVAAALASRTTRIRLGIAVQVLPLSQPLRLAEDVATVDHLSKGRLDFGVGRSGLPGHYAGFNVPYGESRDRFTETLEILIKAWTQERFSHAGKYFTFHDVCVMPKPYQKPHPPIRMAATTEETYGLVGRMGLPIFVAVRTSTIADVSRFVGGYGEGWRAGAHPGDGDIGLSVPVYVAETAAAARQEPEASTLHFVRSVARALQQPSESGQTAEARLVRARRLEALAYDEVLDQLVVYGTPEAVADKLLALREAIGFTTLSAWMNMGGHIPHERVLRSMRLFAERVIPRLA